MEKLAALLSHSALKWGWGENELAFVPFVLYADLPTGQVSFHSYERFSGPAYDGSWDGSHQSETRILDWCEAILTSSATGRLQREGGNDDAVESRS